MSYQRGHSPTPEQLETFYSWLDEPGRELIRDLGKEYPPWNCYRSIENPGHYVIIWYSDKGTVQIVHGHDSYGAGTRVFGVDPKTLRLCNCKMWQEPTQEDVIEEMKAVDQATNPSGLVLPGTGTPPRGQS